MANSLKNKFDSVIFDLDGTLWDSIANVTVAWQQAKNQVDYIRDYITEDTVRSITGMAYDAIFEKLYPGLEADKRNEFKALCAKYEIDALHDKGGKLYPGLHETIKYLYGKYKLFIVSNCQNNYIETFLKHSGISQYLAGYQCYGTKGQPKAENIRDIVNDHALKSPVYIGDTWGDHDSAKKAGVPFIFADYGFGKVDGEQIATISSLNDLMALL
jgi:phosphoglycolate phosphatase